MHAPKHETLNAHLPATLVSWVLLVGAKYGLAEAQELLVTYLEGTLALLRRVISYPLCVYMCIYIYIEKSQV